MVSIFGGMGVLEESVPPAEPAGQTMLVKPAVARRELHLHDSFVSRCVW